MRKAASLKSAHSLTIYRGKLQMVQVRPIYLGSSTYANLARYKGPRSVKVVLYVWICGAVSRDKFSVF